MADIKLNSSGDIDLSTGDIQLTSGLEAIAQALRIRLKFFKGEWFLSPDVGMPYFEKIFVKNPSVQLINSIFRKAILACPGVKDVKDIVPNYDPNTRKLSLSFSATTVAGVIDFDEEFTPFGGGT